MTAWIANRAGDDPSGAPGGRTSEGSDMGIHTYGTNAVDWEQRLDCDRLRTERLARLRAELDRSSLGAVLAFDFTNIRYMTATHIGTWAVDKLIRFSLLVRGGEPIIWDFGSAARHHQLYNPWLDHTASRVTGRRPRPAPRRHPERRRAADRCARRDLHPPRCVPPRRRDRRGGRPQDQARAGDPRDARRTPRGRRHRAADPGRAPGRRHPGRRRPAGLPRGAPDQDPGRDRPAHPGGLDGRRRLRRTSTTSSGPGCGRTSASAW